MEGFINGYDFLNMNPQKYWPFPNSYSKEKRKTEFSKILYSNDYVASEKRDGYWEMVLKDDEGNIFMRARNKGVNGWVLKQDWVPQFDTFFEKMPRGTCLICEVYLPGGTSKKITTILGCGKDKAVQRQAESGYLRLSVFDVISYHGLNIYSCPITERISYLETIRNLVSENDIPYIDVVTYWNTPEEIHENWLKILSEGGEGVVLTRKDNPYEFGKRTARHTLKLKKELEDTVDVFLTGRYQAGTKEYTGKDVNSWIYWYNEVTGEKFYGDIFSNKLNPEEYTPVTKNWYHNWAGSIEIATILNGKVTPIGWISGITEEVREGIVKDAESYKGKVIELQAMEIGTDSAGLPSFRHAKIVRWRNDKNWQECIWNVE